jgi:hypothetical protein
MNMLGVPKYTVNNGLSWAELKVELAYLDRPLDDTPCGVAVA